MSRGERKTMIRRGHPDLSLSRQCRLLTISRSSFYYAPKGESLENLALMRTLDALFLKYPFYGSRQMVRQLRREGVRVGRHRVRRLMRLMGLAAIYQTPRTSEPHPEHRVYPYLLKGLAIERPDQVWCADITLRNHASALSVSAKLHRSKQKERDDGFICWPGCIEGRDGDLCPAEQRFDSLGP